MGTIFSTDLKGLKPFSRGKVRDNYETDGFLLMVATDRISAFDVVMPNPIPGKGRILTRLSAAWFRRIQGIVGHHLVSTDVRDFPKECLPYRDVLEGRTMLVKKTKPLPVECIIRGYLAGSGWKDYKASGAISGVRLPSGLRESSRLPEPIFTPTTKGAEGEHDMPITRKDVEDMIGSELTARMIDIGFKIYNFAAAAAEKNGIIIADTKMEFGIREGELLVIDELLTPDSSRFWPRDEYAEGRPQKSFDKQYLRDYLISISWNQKPPAPDLPPEVILRTREKYEEALSRLGGDS
ncbi:MAG TPA: phosphoribosylaminoimidazolesuccinocarboxamide synthase [Syntrophales bacterium]|nr:phosphoribosylaminoimidazolesuccinocarboxamide synthase [Syntrophales bacterium]